MKCFGLWLDLRRDTTRDGIKSSETVPCTTFPANLLQCDVIKFRLFTHLHWFMCKSQLSEKLNILSLANAFCLSVSGWVIVGDCGLKLTIDPGPVSRPSLLLEWPLAPESRLLQIRWNASKPGFHFSPSTLTRLFSPDFFSFADRLVDALGLVASADARTARSALLGIVWLFPLLYTFRRHFLCRTISHPIRKINFLFFSSLSLRWGTFMASG